MKWYIRFVAGLFLTIVSVAVLAYCAGAYDVVVSLPRHSTGAVPPVRATGEGSVSLTAAPPDISNPHRKLFDAIAAVESAGRAMAIGDEGRALGPYQITEPYWRDGCEAGGVTWDYHAGVWDRAKCEYIMFSYWARHGALTDEQRARMHCGGPDGPLQDSTIPYWQRVEALMETMP